MRLSFRHVLTLQAAALVAYLFFLQSTRHAFPAAADRPMDRRVSPLKMLGRAVLQRASPPAEPSSMNEVWKGWEYSCNKYHGTILTSALSSHGRGLGSALGGVAVP